MANGTDFEEHLSNNIASYAIENTFDLIQTGYRAAVVCFFHFVVYFMNHKHTASPTKPLEIIQ